MTLNTAQSHHLHAPETIGWLCMKPSAFFMFLPSLIQMFSLICHPSVWSFIFQVVNWHWLTVLFVHLLRSSQNEQHQMVFFCQLQHKHSATALALKRRHTVCQLDICPTVENALNYGTFTPYCSFYWNDADSPWCTNKMWKDVSLLHRNIILKFCKSIYLSCFLSNTFTSAFLSVCHICTICFKLF